MRVPDAKTWIGLVWRQKRSWERKNLGESGNVADGDWRERERHDLRAQSVLHSAATAALNDSFSAVVVIRLFCMNNNTDPMRELSERGRL